MALINQVIKIDDMSTKMPDTSGFAKKNQSRIQE